MKREASRLWPASAAFNISVAYIVVGAAWAILSELLLSEIHVILVNRLGFIVGTGLLLYFLASRYATNLRLANEDLEEAGARANAYFESAGWAIIGVDRDGIIVQANPKAGEMFGYRQGELTGRPVEVLVPERLREKHLQHRAAYFKSPFSRPMAASMEPVGRRKDGSEFPIEVNLHFLRTPKSDIVSVFITDITERLALERETRRDETLTALGAIAAGVAHELNNPLAVVLSRIELMTAGNNALPPQVRQDLEVIHRNAQRASRIASELLSSARQHPRERRPLNLNDLVESALPLFREQARREGIIITTFLDSAIGLVSADRTALEQVLLNLLLNARDVLKNGGNITVRTGRSAQPGHIELSVSDSGPGIPADLVPRVFDVFYTTKDSGTGLGLWLCRRIALEHQGRIDVESQVGIGTTFTLTLPVSEEKLDESHTV